MKILLIASVSAIVLLITNALFITRFATPSLTAVSTLLWAAWPTAVAYQHVFLKQTEQQQKSKAKLLLFYFLEE